MHGDEDHMMHLINNEKLVEALGEVKNTIVKGAGHMIPMEKRNVLRELVMGIIETTEKMKGESVGRQE